MSPADQRFQRSVAVIPAWNEAETVGAVVYAALDARLVDEVVVVDNGSTDATSAVAAGHGASVVQEPTAGKGEAMRTGVAAATDADIIVFLDADLVGLRSDHIDGLVANPIFLEGLPVLTGQRALRRQLFDQLDLKDVQGYRVEAALNSLVAQQGLRRCDQVLPGLWHRTKEEKLASPVVGFVTKLGMLACVCWSYTRFALAHRAVQAAS
jgi:hypothetical protein